VADNTLTGYLREAKLGTAEVTLDPEANSPHIDDSDLYILETVEEKPFSSVCELAQATHISRTRASVYGLLTKLLGFVPRLRGWVPHLPSDIQKVRRVGLSLSLLRMLEIQEQRAWHDVVTLDEPWFYCSTDYESI
jgi:hypothetical protein